MRAWKQAEFLQVKEEVAGSWVDEWREVLVMLFGYPPVFIGTALGGVALIWLITAIASPRLVGGPRRSAQASHPKIPCPACQTLNPVTTDERPHRFKCSGCQRVIKLVA